MVYVTATSLHIQETQTAELLVEVQQLETRGPTAEQGAGTHTQALKAANAKLHYQIKHLKNVIYSARHLIHVAQYLSSAMIVSLYCIY